MVCVALNLAHLPAEGGCSFKDCLHLGYTTGIADDAGYRQKWISPSKVHVARRHYGTDKEKAENRIHGKWLILPRPGAISRNPAVLSPDNHHFGHPLHILRPTSTKVFLTNGKNLIIYR